MPMPLAKRNLNPEAAQYLKVLTGQVPDFVPRYSLIGPANKYSTTPANEKALRSSAVPERKDLGGGKFVDMWGVPYVLEADFTGQSIPEPNKFILDDIRNWRKIIKAPDLSGIDWEATCKKDLEKAGDITQHVINMANPGGFFLPLMNFMGFTNGLMAMYEEPDEVHELYTYMADFYCTVIDQMYKYWGDLVDMQGVGDDTATARNPFISPEMYRELVKPYHARVTKHAKDRGLAINMHCCGRCEDYIADWVDFGVTMWNPAQVDNKLDDIKAKYGRKMALTGCWDSSGPAGWTTTSEEEVKEQVRQCIKHYGKDGGFIFYGSSYGVDQAAENKKKWITEAYEAYRAEPYK